MHELKYVQIERIYLFKLLFQANFSNTLMCVLLHLLIGTALRAHIIVVEALYEIHYYYYYQHSDHPLFVYYCLVPYKLLSCKMRLLFQYYTRCAGVCVVIACKCTLILTQFHRFVNPFTAVLAVPSLGKRAIKVTTLKPLRLFVPFA